MKKSKKVPLIIEKHPENYNGYEFISLVKYDNTNFLTIIDNISNNKIVAYVLDYCKQTNIDEHELIRLANDWFEKHSTVYPLSIDLSKRGKSSEFSKILRSFNIDYVSRVIGPLYEFNMTRDKKVRRHKKKNIPKGLEFIDNSKKRLQ